MDIFLITVSALCLIVAFIGSIVPMLPGPPLAFVGMLILQATDKVQFSTILDSGVTLHYLMQILAARGANSIRLCTLLSKPERRKIDVNVDYLGFEIPDEFVVGYGLDYAEKYRNLPYIGILKPHVYGGEGE